MGAPRSSYIMLANPIYTIICLFYLFCSTTLASSAVLGVDLGTEYIKAALVKPGIPLDIVLTKDSRRKELSAVAFKPSKRIKLGEFPERLYGSDAVALAARFPGDVYPNLKTLLGLDTDHLAVKEYISQHPGLKLEADKIRGTAAFRSSAFVAEELPWTVEEILAMELQSIQKNAEALAGKGSSVKDLVVTVPPFYTTEEKRAVILAADLAGLRVLELISDGLAVGLNYATTRKFRSINDGGKAETHMVFDMGAGSTKATILKFQGRTVKDVGKFNKTIQEVKVMGSGWDRTLGGDALNAIIVDDMIANFVASPAAKSVSHTAKDIQSNGKAAAKLWKEAERLRQVLSANANTQVGLEGLYEDLDFKYKITRAEFEKLTEAHAARIPKVIQEALDMAGLDVKDLESIILHGGSSRTPFVQKELEKFIGDASKIKTNVNSDESAVFGAGFRGASLSPSFRVKEIRVSEGVGYASGIKWTNVHQKPQNQKLWQPTSFLGSEKHYTFKNQRDPFTLTFYQQIPLLENISPGSAEKETLALTTQNLTDSVALLKDKYNCTSSDIKVKLGTRIAAESGEVEITSFFVDCEVEIPEEKESMVDSVKGLFGFGKKDQAPLSEEIVSESIFSTSTTSKTSTTSSSIIASGSASAKGIEVNDAKTGPVRRLQVIPLAYTTEMKGLPQSPTSEITRMKERLAAFASSDKSRRLRDEALNQLEGFTYKVRDLLEDDRFVSASTDKERSGLEAISKDTSEWIYSGGAEASREELKSRLEAMKDVVDAIEFRKEEAINRPEKILALQKALNETQTIIKGITEQIKNDTKARAAFSSRSAAKTSGTPKATPVDEFPGLDEEDSTKTVMALPEEETLDPPAYREADLVAPQKLFDEYSAWLVEKLSIQDKLVETDDPVLLSKDLESKTKVLKDLHVELIMKSMRQPYKYSNPPKKTKKAKNGASKTMDKNPNKTASISQAGSTIGPDDEMPSEDQILEMLRKQGYEPNGQRIKDEGDVAGARDKGGVKSEAEEKHDEL